MRPTSLLLPLVAVGACSTAASPETGTDDPGPPAVDTAPVAPPDLTAGGPGDPGPVIAADGSVVFAAVTDGPALRGPGGPAVTFTEDQLWTPCAPLPGGPGDLDHHNLVVPYRGHLVLPWSPEIGTGGVSLFDVSNPCAPSKVGEGTSRQMRETHAMGFVLLPDGDPHAGEYGVVNGLETPLVGASGIQVWDMSDLTAPVAISFLAMPGSIYPDSYNLVTLSLFVQYPYVYVASANAGVFVVDMTDPYAPTVLSAYTFDQGFRAGGVFALGNRLLVSSAEEEQAAILDVSDPTAPQLVPGGLFATKDGTGEPREAYHGNLSGHWALFNRKEGGGGPIVYDISDPSNPTYVGDFLIEEMNGGYVFHDEGFLFTGDSNGGHVIDARDPTNMKLVGSGWISGDLDTTTPYGNVAILAVDDPGDELDKGGASQVMPWSLVPDTQPIAVMGVDPLEGATGVPVTARIGVGFTEFVEPASVFPGSIRVFDAEGKPVPGWTSTQEAIASFAPKAPLTPGTTYTVEVVAGGAADVNGNRIAATYAWTFTTAE